MALGAALAAAGQALLDRRQMLWLAAACLAGGAVALACTAPGLAGPRAPTGEAPRVAIKWPYLLALVPLGAVCFWRSAGNRFRWEGVLAWAAGFACLGVAAGVDWPRRMALALKRAWREGIHLGADALPLGGIVALGAFFRLYRIGEIPLEMGCDLPLIQGNIAQILKGEFPTFFTSHPGREALFFYLAAPLGAAFGLNHTTIKVASALVGVGCLWLIYLLGREMFDRRVGVWAAFLLGISHWHIILSRTGFRLNTLPLVFMAMWYFALRGARTGRLGAWMAAGAFLGLGYYTYNAFIVAPLALCAILLWGRKRIRRLPLAHWGMAILAALWVLLPLGRYIYDDPARYVYRVATRITDLEVPLPEHPWAVLGQNALRAALMFNMQGDAVFTNNVPFYRELGFMSAVCFVLGVGYALRHIRAAPGSLLAVGSVMLLPTALSLAFPHEVPNAGRAIGALVPAILLAAVPASLLQRGLFGAVRASGRVGWAAGALGVLFIASFAAEGVSVYPLYFERYVWHLPDHNYSISLDMARTIDAFGENGEAYIKVWPYWYDGNAIRAQLRRVDFPWEHELTTLDVSKPPFTGEPGKFLMIIHPADAETLAQLRKAFPHGVLLEHRKNSGEIAFYAFYGEREPYGR